MNLTIGLLASYLVIFPLGQLTRLPLSLKGFPEVHLYLTDILVTLLVLVWLVRKIVRRGRFSAPPLAKPILVFSIFALLSLIINNPLLSSREVGIAFLYLIRWVFYAGLYFVIYDLILSSKLKVQNLISSLVVVGVVASVFGLVQYFFLPDTRFLEVYGWDPHYYRLIGTFLDPGFLGLIFVFSLILIIVRAWEDKKKKTWLMAGGIITYLALALTYSRSSYLAYLITTGMIAWWKKSIKFFGLVVIIGLITLFLLPRPGGEGVKLERESTIQARMVNWQQSLKIAEKNLLFGVGFNAYRYAQERYLDLDKEEIKVSHSGAGADSSLLFVLATTGIFGLVCYLWIWVKALFLSLKKISQPEKMIVFASLSVVLIHSLFANSLFYPWVMAWLWLVLGTIKESR